MNEACLFHEYDCLVRNFKPSSVVVAAVHEGPSDASRSIGQIVATFKISEQRFEKWGSLTIGLDFIADGSGQPMTWMSDTGDWGYGILVHGVRTRGDWIQLLTKPFPGNAWVWRKTTTFSANVDSIEGNILGLEPLQATMRGRKTQTTVAGTYTILKVRNGLVEFREEIPSDMPCGDEVKQPSVMPPILRAPAEQFFSADGTPKFATVYTKGC